jgi:WD40 repeat protein
VTAFLSFTSDSRSLVEVRATGAIRIWDVLSGNETRCLVDPPKRKGVVFVANDAALDSNASCLAVNTYCSADEPRQRITLWDVASGRTLGTLPTDLSADELALSPDGQWLAVDSGRVRAQGEPFVDEIRLWRTSDLR